MSLQNSLMQVARNYPRNSSDDQVFVSGADDSWAFVGEDKGVAPRTEAIARENESSTRCTRIGRYSWSI